MPKHYKAEMYFSVSCIFSPEFTINGTKEEVLEWVSQKMEFNRNMSHVETLKYDATLHKNGVMRIAGRGQYSPIAKILFVIMEVQG